MPLLCEYADTIFYSAMGILIILFIAAIVLIQTKLGGGDWPTPPKKGE